MIFLDPKCDIAFKKLFGDITHKNILISFLNSVLELQEGDLIVDVTINDPNNFPETVALKTSIVDVLAQSNWTNKELEIYDRYLDAIRSADDQLETANRIGMEKGIQQGLEKGMEKGKMVEKIAIAKNLLKHLDIEEIAQATGLSIEMLKNLKNEN